MASKEHKIVRRAEAMSELTRLSGQLAERFNVEAVEVNVTNRDAELAEIQRIESLNQLLVKVLEVDATQDDSAKKPVMKSKHGTNK